jgi:hypothetical protein
LCSNAKQWLYHVAVTIYIIYTNGILWILI